MSKFIKTHWNPIWQVSVLLLGLCSNFGIFWLKASFVTRAEFVNHRNEYLICVSNVAAHLVASPLIVKRLEDHDMLLDKNIDLLDGRVSRIEMKTTSGGL